MIKLNFRWNKIQPHRMFVQIYFVMVISIITVTLLTTWVTVKISERLFINTFSISNSNVIDQINMSFDTYNQSVATATSSALQSGTVKAFLINSQSDSLTMWKEYFNMHQQMNQIASNLDAYNAAIIIRGNNDRFFRTNRTAWDIPLDVLTNSAITKAALDEPHRILYQYYEPNEYDPVTKVPMIVVTKAMYDRRTSLQYGMMYIAMKESDFSRFYKSYTADGNDIVILDRSGRILSSNQKQWIGMQDQELLNAIEGMATNQQAYKEIEVLEKKRIVVATPMELSDFYLVNMIDSHKFSKSFPTWITLLICFVISTTTVLAFYKISQKLTKSLTRLVRQISNISKYEFSHKVAETGSYETMQIAIAFNSMMQELQEYLNKLVETERKQHEAELAALQQQINPHFLYNTLASIKFLVNQDDKHKAANTINSLISLLQNTIGNGQETISMLEEMENLRHYAFIKGVRYNDRIQVHTFITPECEEAQIPKLIIQPFVENAFFHAFQNKYEGNIYIIVSKHEQLLMIEIADDGDGLKLENNTIEGLPKSRRSEQLASGIGVRNAHERLRLLYGRDASITIHSAVGEGTQFIIMIPFVTTSEKSKINPKF